MRREMSAYDRHPIVIENAARAGERRLFGRLVWATPVGGGHAVTGRVLGITDAGLYVVRRLDGEFLMAEAVEEVKP